MAEKNKGCAAAIAVEIVSVIVLIAAVLFFVFKISIKEKEIGVYNTISRSFHNLEYDKDLSKFAEKYAEGCFYDEKFMSNLSLSDDPDFVRKYSKNIQSITRVIDNSSVDSISSDFINSVFENESQKEHFSIEDFSTIGIGIYKECVFILVL